MLVTSLESSSSPRLGLGAKCLAGIMSRILQTTSAWACGLCNPKVNVRDCSARGRLCSLWDTQPGCAFPKREKGYHHLQEWPWEDFPFLARISLASSVINDNLCWNNHCCDKQKITDLESLTHPTSCLMGCPGEWQCAGVREFWRMHRRPQLLTDSTSCCWSSQPLRSPVMSLLMKERCKVLLLQPMKSDVMLHRKAVQAVDWSPVI